MLAHLTGVVTKHGRRRYTARCLELDIDSHGSTEEEAKNRLIDALQHHIDNFCETREKSLGKRALPGDKFKGDGKIFELPNHLVLH